MNHRVVITGTGSITSIADSRLGLHAALSNDGCALKPAELFTDSTLPFQPLVGEITDFSAESYLGDNNFRPLDRTSQLLICAAKLALDDSGWTRSDLTTKNVGLVVGTTFCSLRTISAFDRRAQEEGPSCASPIDFANTVINAAAGQTGIWYGLRGVNSTISCGITSALEALMYAAELIRRGREQTILTGGVEDLCVEALWAFQRAGLLLESGVGTRPKLFNAGSHGFAPAEGAALLMLENRQSALERGANILAEIKFGSSVFDCSAATDNKQTAPALSHLSDCITRAINTAMLDSQVRENIQLVSLGANGTPRLDLAEATACRRLFTAERCDPTFVAVKAQLGENMGSSGALQAIDAVASIESGQASSVYALDRNPSPHAPRFTSPSNRQVAIENCVISSIGLDGHCCALVIGAPT